MPPDLAISLQRSYKSGSMLEVGTPDGRLVSWLFPRRSESIG